MIFSELYSVYYNTVAKILAAASSPGTTQRDLQKIVMEQAFSESTMTILPALRTGKWPLLRKDLSSVLFHRPTMPLTMLQKRWLKALLDDPRLKLFDVSMPDLENVKPLFTREDYRIFDQYADGDPYEEETYIRHFRMLLTAIKAGSPVEVCFQSRRGETLQSRLYPVGLEYSSKDDKFRLLTEGCDYREINLARILDCTVCDDDGPWGEPFAQEPDQEMTLWVTDGRNALERAMLHFAHFEKRTQRRPDGNYLLHLKYQKKDEQELVIRVLSFGPFVKALAPEAFVEKIKEKLMTQKSCGL